MDFGGLACRVQIPDELKDSYDKMLEMEDLAGIRQILLTVCASEEQAFILELLPDELIEMDRPAGTPE